MNAKHISADEVKVGDNVWGHNIVKDIQIIEDQIVFNGGRWAADAKETVMVTN